MTQDEAQRSRWTFCEAVRVPVRDLSWGVCQMEVKKVLWPTDFSDNAEKALDYVTSLSEKYQTEVHVLYVIPELALHESWYGDFDKSHFDKIQEWEKKTAKKRLDQVCEHYLKGCPLYIKHIATGDPAEEIIKLIEREKIDMVIMATHGRKGHFHFGSVAEKVVKNSPIPVITIPIRTKK
jgi:nucleotide-binding universal stress UspA family protein